MPLVCGMCIRQKRNTGELDSTAVAVSHCIDSTILMVTDEEENGKIQGMNFGQLYQKYCEEVCPATLVFVSFLSQHDKGRMFTQLTGGAAVKATDSVRQLRLDLRKPDLTRIDGLLGLLSAGGETFSKDVKQAVLRASLESSGDLGDANDNSAATTSSKKL